MFHLKVGDWKFSECWDLGGSFYFMQLPAAKSEMENICGCQEWSPIHCAFRSNEKLLEMHASLFGNTEIIM